MKREEGIRQKFTVIDERIVWYDNQYIKFRRGAGKHDASCQWKYSKGFLEKVRSCQMIISEEQARLFFRLWISLLDFVNKKAKINKNLYGMCSPKGLPRKPLSSIREHLWLNRILIDEFVELNPEKLSHNELDIIAGWKKAVFDSFVVLRHLKSGSIFLPTSQDDKAFIVRGIQSTWNEMLQGSPLPIIVETALLPFCGLIISDGLVVTKNIVLVGGAKKDANQHYRKIKETGGVLKAFNL